MFNKQNNLTKKDITNNILRSFSVFSHISNNFYEDKLKAVESGEFIVDDSCFCPTSEAIKQLSRVSDPSTGQLSEVYDFPNGRDNGKSLPITRRRDFHDLAEYSQEIRAQTDKMNDEILKGQIEAAEKAAFDKELQSISPNSQISKTTD